MNHNLIIILLIISALSAAVTAADKISAKLSGPRVPENTLLLLAALGGSAAMFLTMLLIRHKTRHAKFMAGLPAIMAVQAAAVFFCLRYNLVFK